MGEGELGIVEIDGDGGCAAGDDGGERAEADGAAAEDGDGVGGSDAASCGGVEADGERLDEGEFAQREGGRVNGFLPGDGEETGHGAVALDTEGLVEFAGVGAAAFAGSAGAAGGVGIERDVEAGAEFGWDFGAGFDDRGGDLMAGNARIAD